MRDRWAFTIVVAVLATAFMIALGLFQVGQAAAATYVTACPNAPGSPGEGEITDDAIETRNQRIADVAICETISERLEAVEAQLASLGNGDTLEPAQRVALTTVDRNRLDLLWWGTWALVGIGLLGLIASKWNSATALWKGLPRG